MAIENEPSHHGAKQNEDVEMADISLLNNPEEDNSTRNSGGEAHSWYSAHGRGFTLHGRQSETQEAPSHIGTVLGEAYYSRERCRTPPPCYPDFCHSFKGKTTRAAFGR